MKSLKKSDSSREDEFECIVSKYMEISVDLLQQIENDHLLAIILEIPSDIDRMSIWDISIKYELDDFLNFYRLQPIIQHLWTELYYLDPSKQFDCKPTKLHLMLSQLWKNPTTFYYSPIGFYILTSVFYILYVIFVSIIVYNQSYPYSDYEISENLVWFCNFGYILYELEEILFKKQEYFTEMTNYWDIIIAVDWIILIIIRFLGERWWPSQYEVDNEV